MPRIQTLNVTNLINMDYCGYKYERALKFWWPLVLILAAFSVLPLAMEGAGLTSVSDTISASVPGAGANHIIKFILTNAIPASGKIIVTPQTDAFTISAALDYSSIDFLVNDTSKILSASAGSATGSAIGVSVTAGTSGNITFTLNNADGLSAGSVITVKINDQQIKNPAAVGSYKINIKTYDSLNAFIDQADAMLAIISPVLTGALYEVLATLDKIFSPVIATTATLTNPDGTKFTIDFPADFLDFSDDIHFQISSYQKEDFAPAASPPSGKSVVAKVYDINIFRVLDGSAITSFSKAITFNFFYSDDEISGIDENTLQPYYWDGAQWVLVSGSTVFSGENKVTVPVNHLTVFVLMGEPMPEVIPEEEAAPAPAPEGGGGGLVAPAPPTSYTGISGAAVVSPDTGGSIVRLNADGSSITLSVPAGFWILPTTFTITVVSKKTAASVAPVPAGLAIVGDNAYSILAKDTIGTVLTRFLKPLTMILRYTNAQSADFDEKTLKMYSLDQVLKIWKPVPDSKIDIIQNSVSGTFDHLTLFAIMGTAIRPTIRAADFNQDNKVDLVDFSILLYNWGMPKNEAADLNKDGRVDLVDFSIMLYWWTG